MSSNSLLTPRKGMENMISALPCGMVFFLSLIYNWVCFNVPENTSMGSIRYIEIMLSFSNMQVLNK